VAELDAAAEAVVADAAGVAEDEGAVCAGGELAPHAARKMTQRREVCERVGFTSPSYANRRGIAPSATVCGMTLEHTRTLARYNRWMNDKLYAVAAKLTDQERKRDRGAFFKSIHGTLNHLLLADRVWMGRFTGLDSHGDWLGPGGIRSLDQELYSDFDELRRERRKMDDDIEAWVGTLTTEKLAVPLRYVRKGVTYDHPLWWSVAHLFNHQTHHRGQLTTLLMQAGHDPGVTDLIAMLREQAG
jgi:uncharacterized damage-inducible protein DinB